MSVALSPFAAILVIPYPLCLFHSVHQQSTVMLLSHVCGSQSICCHTCNTIPPMSVPLCPSAVYCYAAVPMSVALSPFAAILVIPYPPNLFHSVHQLSTVMLLSHVCGSQSICCHTCNTIPPCLFHSVHQLSAVMFCPMSMALGHLLSCL